MEEIDETEIEFCIALERRIRHRVAETYPEANYEETEARTNRVVKLYCDRAIEEEG